jgi:hypothetical protein
MRVVYIIGAPRSGTTWLQRMLGSHPEIASPQETEFLNGYIEPLLAEWKRQLPSSEENWRRMRYKGLPAVLTEREFEGLLEHVVSEVYAAVLRTKPEALIVLEKTLNYCLHLDTVLQFVPDARFIHIIRDGRDVAVSLRRAAVGWGDWWAPRQIADAAKVWQRYVEAAQQASCAPGGYMEVRYEDLVSADGPRVLAEALTFCGVAVDDETAQSLYSYGGLEDGGEQLDGIVWGGEVARRLPNRPEEPEGFRGPGGARGWKSALSAAEQRIFDYVCGDLLIDLGYEPDQTWYRGSRLPRSAVRAELAIGTTTSFVRERLLRRLLSRTREITMSVKARFT